MLDGFARNLWADWADGKLTDDQAATLAETLELRKREVRGVYALTEDGKKALVRWPQAICSISSIVPSPTLAAALGQVIVARSVRPPSER